MGSVTGWDEGWRPEDAQYEAALRAAKDLNRAFLNLTPAARAIILRIVSDGVTRAAALDVTERQRR